MSVREEDRKKSGCTSRGVAIAAAALGVGVGTALYYLFNKRNEAPNSEGSTSDWSNEPPPFHRTHSDDSYTTISEHETTDTSMNISQSENGIEDESMSSYHSSDFATDDYSGTSNDSDLESYSEMSNPAGNSTFEMDEFSLENTHSSASDSDENDWDVTTSSAGLPVHEISVSVSANDSTRSACLLVFQSLRGAISPRTQKAQENELISIKQQAFRQRGWTLEECSICFDVMLRNQEITSLPCAHNFHTECILPWLQEKQTCPNCRKVAE